MFNNKRLSNIYYELEEVANQEQMKLFRMARRLKKHGGSDALINDIRNEAWSLTNCRIGDLLNPFRVYKYAFKD